MPPAKPPLYRGTLSDERTIRLIASGKQLFVSIYLATKREKHEAVTVSMSKDEVATKLREPVDALPDELFTKLAAAGELGFLLDHHLARRAFCPRQIPPLS